MNIAQIRRDALALGIRGVRLPLTAAEAILQNGQDTSDWPPTLAFERAEAAVTELVGKLWNDHTLLASSQLQRAAATQREEAAVKRAEAEAKRMGSRRRADEKAAQVDADRRRAQEAAAQRQRSLADERRRAEQKIEQTAVNKRATTRKQTAAQINTIEKVEAQAEAERLRDEAEALRLKEHVVDAQDKMLDLEREVRAKKAARRAG